MMGRKVCIKKVEGRSTIALHDVETGECFADQYSVEITNDENQIPIVVVTFRFVDDFLQSSAKDEGVIMRRADASMAALEVAMKDLQDAVDRRVKRD